MAAKRNIRSITYLKNHAAEVLATVEETRRPMIITQKGEGKMVLQDIETYQAMKDAIALLKIVAQGRRSVERGASKPAARAFADIERRRSRRG